MKSLEAPWFASVLRYIALWALLLGTPLVSYITGTGATARTQDPADCSTGAPLKQEATSGSIQVSDFSGMESSPSVLEARRRTAVLPSRLEI